MKCPNCGEDLFKGQYACHKCGAIYEIAVQQNAPKKTEKETKKIDKGEKDNG